VTGSGVEGAKLAFTARNGVISNLVYDGSPGQASYRTNWYTGPGGQFPTNVWLPTVDWDLRVSKTGYADKVIPGVILSPVRGTVTNLGVITISPSVTNATQGPVWWYKWNVVNSVAKVTNDFAAVNAGQLKWIATNAYNEMQTALTGGAGTTVSSMVCGFKSTNNYRAVNLGQVKERSQAVL